jgi:tetratricopeptide (TPR) repeat protein/serine/threonine protein kinase
MCPSEEEIRRFKDGELGEAEKAKMDAHLEVCPRCLQALEAMADADARWIAGAIHRGQPNPPRARSPAPDLTADPARAASLRAEAAPKDTALPIPEGETTAGNQPTGRLSPEERDDAICDQFKAAWRAGSRPRIEHYLEGVEGHERADLLGKLLRVELELRVEKNDHPVPEPYRARWPEYRTVIDSAFDSAVPPQPAMVQGIELRPGAEPIPGYRLVKKLGGGGSGEVWKAVGQSGIELALKFVHLDGPLGPQEHRAIASVKNIRHIHLLALFDIRPVGRYLVIAMELAERTLLDVFREAVGRGTDGIPTPEIFDYFQDAARGIDYLNEPRHPAGGKGVLGVQHRDIKPQNLLLVGGCVKVGDYGLARVIEKTLATASDTGGLSPSYAAPEFFNRQTSGQSDQYSLACTYCHMRGGKPPFTGTPYEIMRGHLLGEPDLSMLPEREKAVVARALAKSPKERWPSCKDFVKALRSAGPPEVQIVSAIEPPKEKVEQSARPFLSPETGATLHGPHPAETFLVQPESPSSSVGGGVSGQEEPADALVCDAEDIQAPPPKSGEIPYLADKPDDLREELDGDQSPLGANVHLTRPPGLSWEEKFGYALGCSARRAQRTLKAIARFGRRRKVITGLLLALAIGLVLWVGSASRPILNVLQATVASLTGAESGSDPPGFSDVKEVLMFIKMAEGKQQPQSASDYYARGFGRFVRDDYDGAIADLGKVIRLNPKSAQSYCLRGEAWRAKQDYDKAITDYTEAIRLDPEEGTINVLFGIDDAYDGRGRAWGAKREYDKAIADYDQAIRLYPIHLRARRLEAKNAAAALRGKTGDTNVGPGSSYWDSYWDRSIEAVQSDFASTYRHRGDAWGAKREYDKAIADYTEAIRLNPKNARAYTERGHVYYKKEDYDKAITDYTEAIRLDPKDADAHVMRGNAWDNKHEFAKALADYNEAIRLDSKSSWAHRERGVARYGQKDYSRAISDLDEAIRLNPKDTLAYRKRGDAWHGKKEYAKAIADYTEAIRLDPKYAAAYNRRAWVWATCPDARLRDGKRAVESATCACELSGWKEAYHLGTLAAAYAEVSDFAKAVEWQEKANGLYTDAEGRAKGQERLKLYRNRKPYREP